MAHAVNKVTNAFVKEAEAQPYYATDELANMVAEYIFVLERAVIDMKNMFSLQGREHKRGN